MRMNRARRGWLWLIALPLGCGGGSFDVAPGAGGDTGALEDVAASDTADASPSDSASGDSPGDSPGDSSGDGAPDVGGSEGGGGDVSPDDVIVSDVPVIDVGPPTCASLPAGATELYVDKRYAGVSTGSVTCPFTTITAALAIGGSFLGTRTIHVSGAVVPVVYNEASSIVIPANVIVVGDGPGKTSITASGPCGSTTCAVNVFAGGTLDGFTVLSASGDGIVTAAGSPPPIVKNVNANGNKSSGIECFGAAEIGPNVSANRNGLQGLVSSGSGLVHIGGSPISFDSNVANGIDIEGNATLKFDGGTAVGNGLNGLRLAWTAPTLGTGPLHTVTGLVATGNKNNGIGAYNGQNFKLRSSKLLNNLNYGIYYGYVGTSSMDLGAVGDLGNNIFGTAASATRNTKAGLYLCKSRGAATQPGEGDSWSTCAPTQASIAGCDTAPVSYVDVAYIPAVAGDPVVATTSCIIAP